MNKVIQPFDDRLKAFVDNTGGIHDNKYIMDCFIQSFAQKYLGYSNGSYYMDSLPDWEAKKVLNIGVVDIDPSEEDDYSDNFTVFDHADDLKKVFGAKVVHQINYTDSDLSKVDGFIPFFNAFTKATSYDKGVERFAEDLKNSKLFAGYAHEAVQGDGW